MSAFARWEDPSRELFDDIGPPTGTPVIPNRDGALLQALGKPADVLVTIDFESYHSGDYSLKKQTTEGYVRDPRFEVIGVGVKVGESPSAWLEEWEFRAWAKHVNWNRVALCAHHAHFDGLILSHHYGIRPGFILDTLSMARALHGVSGASLEILGPRYGLGEKGTEIKNVKGKHRSDFTQAEWLRFGEYCNNDVKLTAGLLAAMSRGFPPLELWLIDTTVRMFTEPRFVADGAVLERARDAERAKKKELLQKIAESAGVGNDEEAARALLMSNQKFAELLRTFGVEPPMKTSGRTGELTFAFAKNDPGFQALVEHEDDAIRALAETRLAVKSTITETRSESLLRMGERGPLTVYLKYAGAHTQRWSGGDRVNFQNFNRGGDLRDAILAPDGHTLAVSDSGQIEARKLAWLAGDEALLETFRRNDAQTRRFKETGQGSEGDFYSDEGSKLFLKKLSKKETPIERQLAKNMILGLGFGMGWGKFAAEQLKGMLGSAPVQFTRAEVMRYGIHVGEFGARPYGRSGKTNLQIVEDMKRGGIRLELSDLLVHCAVADYFVRLYRDKNAKIVGVWRAMEQVLQAMTPDEGPEVRMIFGPLIVKRHAIVKPSGLALHYPGLRKTGSGYSYLGGKSGREHTKIYGGLLTENVVQSLARDVVAEQALWIRARGYRIGTTTHDEIVTIVPEAQGPECLAYMFERMRIPPSWCANLPLDASGALGKRYGDAK